MLSPVLRRLPGRALAAAVLATLAVLVAACGGGTSSASGDDTAWLSMEITDVDGQTFTLAGLEGPVFVENFATWCPTCRQQLGRTEEAAAAMGDEASFVVLSVETDIDPADVAAYASENGFTSMRFAVMSPELLAAFAGSFGTSAVNPPSTPHVVIGADGNPGPLETGGIAPDEIEAALRGEG